VKCKTGQKSAEKIGTWIGRKIKIYLTFYDNKTRTHTHTHTQTHTHTHTHTIKVETSARTRTAQKQVTFYQPAVFLSLRKNWTSLSSLIYICSVPVQVTLTSYIFVAWPWIDLIIFTKHQLAFYKATGVESQADDFTLFFHPCLANQ
jgi:hypothetical protein